MMQVIEHPHRQDAIHRSTPMEKEPRILLLEDMASDAELIERELRIAGISFTSQRAGTKEAFEKALSDFAPDIILSDYNLPQFSGLDALRMLKEKSLRVPFILVTGSLTEEIAVLCMKEGADDYILKSALKRLPSAVLGALKKSQTEKEKVEAVEALRESQEQLRQAQKLEAIGRLAGGIAHDFNNLLTVISGHSALLLRASRLNEADRESVDEVSKAAQRATSLVRQLLAFSRKQVLQPQVLNPNSLVDGISKMLKRLIGEDIEIGTSLHANVGHINVDPGQFEQVLTNLVVNARDAMPNGGKITIETENVELDQAYSNLHIAVRPGPYVMVAVSDNGEGMDTETQKQIFEPFFTTKEIGKGTGLGLSTVYGIVNQSNGNIWVYSEVGRGTTFKIYLPRVDDHAEKYKRSVPDAKPTMGSETILLVEDEEMLRKLACQILKGHGYQILESANGGEAIAVSEQHEGAIHLLLTDVIMPGMNGQALATRLVESRPSLQVLFMSGYTDDAIVHQGVLNQSANFIQKPFPPASLARKVREILDQEKAS